MARKIRKESNNVLSIYSSYEDDYLDYELTENEIKAFDSLERAYEQGFISYYKYKIEWKKLVSQITTSREPIKYYDFAEVLYDMQLN